VRRWERITASVLRAPGEIHESQLHRARKVLSKFSVLLVDDTAASGSDTRHREADDAHAHYHGVRRLLPWTNSPTDPGKLDLRTWRPHLRRTYPSRLP
jgi:hypothetical protein